MALPKEPSTAYDELLDMLADESLAPSILDFHASFEIQARIDDLLEKNCSGRLSAEGFSEVEEFERVDHLVRILKARVRQKLSS